MLLRQHNGENSERKGDQKMKLKPLKQWICDGCHQIIEDPEQGWVEWLTVLVEDSVRNKEFRIVHHAEYSPRKPHSNCYRYGWGEPPAPNLLSTTDLTDFVGQSAIPHLLMLIDPGPCHQKQYQGPTVENLREWADFARRLTIPYYEEARVHWQKAIADGLFEGHNEISIYSPDMLKRIIKRYGTRE
jgi:hypothetical protein